MKVFVCGDLGKAIYFDISMGAIKDNAKKQFLAKDTQHKTWSTVKFWFNVYSIMKNDHEYVNNVQFSKASGLFITGTLSGEVKFWSAIDC